MEYVARDVMNTDVISVPNSMDLRELAKLFLEQGITGAPVVDDDGNLQGVISQTDLIYYNLTRDDELVMDSLFYQTARMEGRHIPTGFQVEDCNTGRVEDVMTPVVHSVTETTGLDAVARLMTRKRIHRVIVRNGRKVAGIISALDVLRHLHQPPKKSARKSATASAAKSRKVGAKRPKSAAATATRKRASSRRGR